MYIPYIRFILAKNFVYTVMAKKIPQALKFTEGLDADLHTLAEIKKVNYNAYVEAVLSSHVIIQKRAMREISEREKLLAEKAAAQKDDGADVSSVDSKEWN